MKTHLFSFCSILMLSPGFSQTTITLQPGPAEGKDASIWTLEPTTNYGDFPDFIAAQWTWDGNEGTYRSLLEFDLDTIPQGAEITCAHLSLYYNDLSGANGQEGENESILQRITAPWSEDLVTWSTMPTTTSIHQVILPTSTFISEDYTDIDVTDLIMDMIADPSNSYGFMIRLFVEETYASMKFCSSDYTGADFSKLPKLEICYNAVAIDSPEMSPIKVAPNPFEDHIEIQLTQPLKEESTLTICDMTGREIVTAILPPGINSYVVETTSGFSSGLYIVNLNSSSAVLNTTIVHI